MELVNEFSVDVPVDEAWKTLTDVELIAPCLPGAQLQEIEGDTYRGIVKVKVGPITAQFKGEATFVERDEVSHRVVLKAAGRDTGGKGNASALITAQLEPAGSNSTHVKVTTDLTITGKVAQFGRGALADVSSKLINQFVEQLETTVLNQPAGSAGDAASAAAAAGAPADATDEADDAPPAETAGAGEPAAPVEPKTRVESSASAESGAVRKIDSPEAQPIDLLDAAGAPMLKRLVPVGIALLVLLFLLRRRRR